MPKFVVPAVATTANRPSAPASAIVSRSAAAVQPAVLVDGDADEVAVHDVAGRLDRGVRLGGAGHLPPGRRVTDRG